MIIRNWAGVIATVEHGAYLEWKIMSRVGTAGVAGVAGVDPAGCCLRSHNKIARAWLQPGLACKQHAQPGEEEIIFVVSGAGRMWVDGETRAVGDGDAVYIPAGAVHQIANDGKDWLEFVTFTATVSPQERNAGVIVRNWRGTVPWMEPDVHGAGIDWRVLARRGDTSVIATSDGKTETRSSDNTEAEGQCLRTIKFFSFAILQPGMSYMPHGHDHEEIYYIIKGKGRIRSILDDRTEDFAVRGGDAVLTTVGEKHQLFNDGDEAIEFIAWAADPQE